jgi:prepilin-type N-terminal cleavage/methylation domain-containing protein
MTALNYRNHPAWLLRILFLRASAQSSAQSGFTLLESLIAIVVVAILLASIAPMLALTTAARIQARRVDLATQAARTYIDGVRSGAIAAPDQNKTADFLLGNFGVAAPTALPTDSGIRVDTDGDGNFTGPTDLFIQPMRNAVSCLPTPCTAAANDESNARKQGFTIAVRVYRADAFNDSGALGTTPAGLVFIGTLGSRKSPLVVVKSDIVSGTTKFSDFNNRL